MPAAIKRVLFVCTGNTCRSPMAETLFRQALLRLGIDGVQVASAGLSAREGERASEYARLAMEERGLSLAGHRARRFTPEMARDALVLCMTQAQASLIPGARSLRAYLGKLGDVMDPFGGDLDTYRVTARILFEETEELSQKWAREER